MQDIYDFAPGNADYPGFSQGAVNNAYDGFLLGTKPFLVNLFATVAITLLSHRKTTRVPPLRGS